MKKKITVNVSYFCFSFDNVDEAVQFAETAAAHIKKGDKEVSIEIEFVFDDKKEEEANQNVKISKQTKSGGKGKGKERKEEGRKGEERRRTTTLPWRSLWRGRSPSAAFR